jgi:hypothetical protein
VWRDKLRDIHPPRSRLGRVADVVSLVEVWLCLRVGADGRVVATDISARFLDALDFGNLEVRVHNIVEEDLEQGAFDLVHAWAVLTHRGQRTSALKRQTLAESATSRSSNHAQQDVSLGSAKSRHFGMAAALSRDCGAHQRAECNCTDWGSLGRPQTHAY